MIKRLQVLLPEEELREIQRHARRHRMTTAEWVRRSLRTAREADGGADTLHKLAAVRAASEHAFPTGDVETMLRDIARGYTDRTNRA